MSKRILYLSYDGMTDPLGQSQVIPYLIGIAEQTGYTFDLLSCEKPDRYIALETKIESLLANHPIRWIPIPFSLNRTAFTRLKDMRNLAQTAMQLCRQNTYSLVHCRSYIAAFVGQKLKKRYQIPLLFDMRGFWIDERVEGGLWNLKNPIYQMVYRYYKQKEKYLIQESDAIISLTEAGRDEIYSWTCYQKTTPPPPIEVIPCSSDFALFSLVSPAKKAKALQILQISDTRWPIVSYLGSIGTWYMLDEMMRFFALLQQKYPDALLLFITKDGHERIKTTALQYGIDKQSLCIKEATRQEVPLFLSASDLNLFFIKPTYAKKASSPVKLGEVLACGLPVIANTGVGDIAQIVAETQSGLLVSDFSDITFDNTINKIPELMKKTAAEIRSRSKNYYLLENAVKKYVTLYQVLIEK